MSSSIIALLINSSAIQTFQIASLSASLTGAFTSLSSSVSSLSGAFNSLSSSVSSLSGTFGSVSAASLQVDSNLFIAKYLTTGTGNITTNTPAGQVTFAIGATAAVVTNSLVSSSSLVLATVATAGTNVTSVVAVPNNGAFELHLNNSPAADVVVNWLVVN